MLAKGIDTRALTLNLIMLWILQQGFYQGLAQKDTRMQGDLQNVDSALTRLRTPNSPVFYSRSKCLFYLIILVAGVGFEPTTFRL